MYKPSIFPLVLVGVLIVSCNPSTPSPTTNGGASPSTTTQITPVASSTPTPTSNFVGLETVAPITGMPSGTDGYPWWNDTVFYEIFVRSFQDSDGDGIGDFNGIIQRLDYLNDGDASTNTDLGITGIWLMPIFPSPSYHGYDVLDYYSVNPQYGSLQDFTNLVNEAHARGIRVIIDLVLNHTSDQHPWFVSARDPASPYHDWYVWSDVDPGYLGSWGQQVWFPLAGKYIYALFTPGMPDLNYTNPEVGAEMQEIVRFWLEEMDVDGFRLDAAKHLIEEGAQQVNTPSTHAWYKNFRPAYKQIDPQALTVGEVWEDPTITAAYVQGDELDLAFDFYLAQYLIDSVNSADSILFRSQLKSSFNQVPPLQFTPFSTNHDQNRLMDQLGYDPQKVKVAASILLTAPGVPFLYYGEEIGMQGVKPDPQIRRPMQWSTDAFAGFSTRTPWEPLAEGWETDNVAEQTNDPGSILNRYRSLIRARNQHAALRVGDLNIVTTVNDSLYCILRISQEEAVLVLINLSDREVSDYQLSLEGSALPAGTHLLFSILGQGSFPPLTVSAGGGFSNYVPLSPLPPYTVLIRQLQWAGP